ncbi:TonB-dependent receptor [Asticcacaulis machinosus]|uniref:TonB-dependent receptor n=1 Tax=Asticcacaulis machinosus TaxID=2984211 RepID=A0ABT5HNI8_9CAUL|nr:TonB-dependent receptor [Asticcacaulis machinosus]MDC7677806.1 TonB-dependent receptor [Asticcacaulis machinosus]
MLKFNLRRGASLVSLASVLTGMVALPVMAQDVTASSDDGVQEVVVTGFRLQNRQAMIAKDNDERIAEFMTGDELGQQPDYNISDSFRRMPGVQTEFDEDEGRFVGIRGLDPNFTVGALDGSTIATSERGNRQLNLESVPTTAVKRLEVFKSRTPDMEGNAIGGTINLVTRSAFDKRGLYWVGSAFIGMGDSQDIPGKGYGRDSDDGVNYRFDGTVSTTFGDADQFGVLFTGAFSRKRRDQERFVPGGYNLTNGVPVQASHLWSSYPNTVDRYGGTLKLEWRPMETLTTALTSTYYIQADQELRHSHQLTRGAVSTDPALTSGNKARVTTAGGFVRFNDFPIDKPLTIVQGSADWTPDDNNVVKFRAAYSEASFVEASNQLQYNLATSAANAYNYTINDGIPSAVLDNSATFLNPFNYKFNSYNPYEDDSDEYITEASLDWRFNMERGDYGWGFGAGAKTRDLTRDFDRFQNVYALASGQTSTLQDVLMPTNYTSVNATTPQLFIDFDKFLADKNANPSKYILNAATSNLNRISNDYVVNEGVDAVYVQARHAGERHSLIFGGRYEDTTTEIDGYRVNGSTVTPLSRKGNYNNFLPSAVFSYNILDNMKFRAAYYEAIGRANPSDLGTNESLNQTALTLSRGNPDLKPRKAKNYDAAVEMYLPRKSGMVSVAVFSKDIKDEIYSMTLGTTTIDGAQYTITQPQNVANASVSGLELSFVKNELDFLPGLLSNLGLSANYTRLHGEAELPNGVRTDRLNRQPAHQANLAVFYEDGPLKARVSYAYTGERYTSFSTSDPATNRYDKPFKQVDLTARYNLGRAQIIGEVRNLTDEHRENYDQYGVRDLNYFGRQLWLGVAFKQ